jgi:hypothetical protein
VNPERTNPVWEENEKEKEATMQVTGLLCQKSFSEEGRYRPVVISKEKAESLMDETVKKVRRDVFVYTNTWRGYDSLVFCR